MCVSVPSVSKPPTHTAGPEHSTARALGAHGSHTTRAKRDISTTRSSYANQNLRKARTRSSCGGRRRPTNDRHLEVAIASAVRLRDSRRSAARHDDASRSPRSRPQSRPPVPAGRATALDAAIGGCRVESEVTWQRAWERPYRRYLHCAKRRCGGARWTYVVVISRVCRGVAV